VRQEDQISHEDEAIEVLNNIRTALDYVSY